MFPAATPTARVLLQFRRRTMALSAVAAALGLVVAALLDPTRTRGGAIVLAISSSVLASLIVAAVALERAETANDFARLGVTHLFQDRLQDLPSDLWTELLEGSHSHFRVLGMANHGYLNDETAKTATDKALRAALARKNVSSLATALEDMLSGRLTAHIDAARRYALRFEAERVVDLHVRVYADLASNKARAAARTA